MMSNKGNNASSISVPLEARPRGLIHRCRPSLTTCAEQNAIAAAVTLHGPALRLRAVVVVNLNNTASQPCGACRQTIHEQQ
jgi:cytidine deaminase